MYIMSKSHPTVGVHQIHRKHDFEGIRSRNATNTLVCPSLEKANYARKIMRVTLVPDLSSTAL